MAKLKKVGLVLLAVLLCVCAAVCFSGMTESRRVVAQGAQYTSISVALADGGDTLYTSLTADELKAKLVVKGFTDGASEGVKLLPGEYTLTVNGAGVSGAQPAGLVSGSNNIRVEAGGASATLTVSAVANTVDKVTVNVNETLLCPGEGEYAGLWVNATGDAEGFPVFFTDMRESDIAQYLVVDVTYADGSTAEDIEDYSVTGRWSTAEEQTLTIEYTYNGIRSQGSISIVFTERDIVKIEVRWANEQEIIYSGALLSMPQTFVQSLKNFSVWGQYNDGGEMQALSAGIDYTFSGDLHIAGTQPQQKDIVVSYVGNPEVQAEFRVTVTPETPSSVSFFGGLSGMQYTHRPLNPTGVMMNVMYAGAPTGSGGYKYVQLSDIAADHVTVEYYDSEQRLLPNDYITFDVKYVKIIYTENNVPFESDYFAITEGWIQPSTMAQPSFDTNSGKYDPETAATTTMTGYDEDAMDISYTVTDTGDSGISYDDGLTWDVEGDTVTFKATAAGVYKITVTLTDQNYIWAGLREGEEGIRDLSYVWTVDKITATPTVTIEGWTYNTEGKHNDPQVTLAGSDEDTVYKFTYAGMPNGSGVWNNFGEKVPDQAGEYTVQASVSASRNYSSGSSDTYPFIIERADAPVPTLNPKTYTGTTLTATVPESPQYYTTYENKGGTIVGTYYVLLELADANNYKWPEGITVTEEGYAKISWQIVKAQLTVPSLASVSTVFQDDESGAAVEQSNAINHFIDGRFEFTVSSGSGARVDGAFVYATNAGTYTITVKLDDPDNYEWEGGGPAEQKLTWTITPKLLQKPSLGTVSGSTYTGNPLTYTVNGYDALRMGNTPSDSLQFDDVKMTATNAGGYTLTISLSNPNNYNWNDGSGSSAGTADVELKWTISAAENKIVSVDMGSLKGFTFGDVFTAPAVDADFDPVNPEDIHYTYFYAGWNENGPYTEVPVPEKGGYYYVVVDIDGTDNYNPIVAYGSQDTTGFTVSRQQIAKPAWSDPGTVYSYDSKEQTRTLTGFRTDIMSVKSAAGAKYTITDNKDGSFTATNADTYTITFSLGDNAVNYEWNDASGYGDFSITWEIKQAENTLTVTVDNIVYGAKPTPKVTEATFGAGTVEYVYYYKGWEGTEYAALDSDDPFDSGYYYVVATIPGTDNYKVVSYGREGVTGFTISRLATDKPAIAGTYEYTGQYQEVKLSPEAGEKYTVTANGTQKDAETYKITVTLTYNYKWTGEADNSDVRFIQLDWKINKKLVAAPELTGGVDGRYLEYTGGILSPTVEKNDLYSLYTTADSSAYGAYTLTVELKDPKNHAWNSETFDAGAQPGERLEDFVDGTDGEFLVMWYRITKQQYQFTISMQGWVYFSYDGSINEVVPSGIPEAVLQEIRDGKAKEVYKYYLESAGEGSAVTGLPTEETGAGRYILIMQIVGTEESNFADSSAQTTFKVSPAEMTDVSMPSKEDETALTYSGKSLFSEAIAGRTATTVDGSEPTWMFSLNDSDYFDTLDLTNAGTYTVHYRVTETNHKQVDGTFKVVINRLGVAVVWNPEEPDKTFTYNGTEQTVTAAYKDVNGETVYLKVTISGDAPFLNAETYTFTAAFDTDEDKGYQNYELTGQITEEFEMQAAPVKVTIGIPSQTYDGNTYNTIDGVLRKHYEVTEGQIYAQGGKKDDLGVTFTIEGGAENVGDYSVYAEWSNKNYAVIFIGEENAFHITHARMTNVNVPSKEGETALEYNGKSQFVAAVAGKTATLVKGTPTWTFSLKFDDNGEGYTSEIELKNQGTYTVYYRVTESNHETATGEFEVVINPYKITVDWCEDNFTYNGQEQTVTAAYKSFESESPVSLEVNTTDGSQFLNAGNYTFKVSFREGDNALGNYTLVGAETQKTYEMKQREVWVQANPESVEYGDGVPTFGWSYAGDSDGNISHQFIDAEMPEGGWFEMSTDAAISKDGLYIIAAKGDYTITAKYVGSGNYEVVAETGTLIVSPRAITVEIATAESTYGQPRAALNATVSESTPLYVGDSPEIVFSLSADVNTLTDVGTYPITLENVKGEGEGYYYTIASNSGALLYTVNPADITDVTVTPAEGLIYTAQNQFTSAFSKSAVTVNHQKQTWTFSLTYNEEGEGYLSEEEFELKNAGTYKIYYRITADNHNPYDAGVEGYFTVVIGKAPLTITVTGETIYGEDAPEDSAYTITPDKLLDESLAAAGIVAGKTFTISHDYTRGDDVGTYYLTVTKGKEENQPGNYNVEYVSGEGSASFLTVKQRPVTLVIGDVEVDYGNVGKLTLSVDEESLPLHTTESVENFLQYLAVYDNQQGSGDPVKLTNELPAATYYIIGKDTNADVAANYEITFVGETRGNTYGEYRVGVVTISISKKWPENNFYDNTPKTCTASTNTPGVVFKYSYERLVGEEWVAMGEDEKPVNAGTYKVKISVEGGNYSINAGDSEDTYTIAKAPFTVRVFYNTENTHEYDGQPYQPTVQGWGDQMTGLDGTTLKVTPEEGITNVTGPEGVEFTAKLSLSNDTNYKLSVTELKTIVIITPYEISVGEITWADGPFTYDGTDQWGKISATAKGLNGDSFDLTIGVQEFKAAKTYTFTASLPNDDKAKNYVLAQGEGANQKTYEMLRRGVTVKANDGSLVYGETPAGLGGDYSGESKENPLLQFVAEDGISMVVATTATNKVGVGNYRIYISGVALGEKAPEGVLSNYLINGENGEDFGGYTSGASEYDGTMTVTPRPVSVSIETPNGEAYSGAYQTATATARNVEGNSASGPVNGDVLTFKYTYALGGETSEDGAYHQGTYTVTVEINNSGNYSIAAGAEKQFTIIPRTVEVQWEEETFTYNGTNQAESAAALAWFEGVGDDDKRILLSTTTVGEFKDANAVGESYTFTAAFATDPDEGFTNEYGDYVLEPSTNTCKYTMQKAGLKWVEEFSWKDDGNENYAWIYLDDDFMNNRTAPVAALATNSEITIEEGELLTVTYYSDESCAPEFKVESFSSETPAGTYWAVVTAEATGNYNELTEKYSFTVEQLAVSVSWHTGSFTFDGALKTNTLVYQAYMTVSYTPDSAYSVTIDEAKRTVTMTATTKGTYSVTVTLKDNNYKWAKYDGGADEDKDDLLVSWSISASQNSWTLELSIEGWTFDEYDEATNMPKAQSMYGAVVFYYTVAGAQEPTEGNFNGLSQLVPANAGTYWVVAYVAGTEDYGALWATADFTIHKAEIDAPVADNDAEYVYDGNNITFRFKEGFKESLMYITDNVQVNANEEGYTVTVTLRDTNNYMWSEKPEIAERTFTFVIHKKPVNAPAVPADTWTYNGGKQLMTPKGYDSSAMGIESMEGLTLEVSGTTTVTFGAENAGTYKVVLSLKDANNFAWAEGAAVDESGCVTLTWVIGKAENSWTTAPKAEGWTYGETPVLPTAVPAHGEVVFLYYTYTGGEYVPMEAPTSLTDADMYYVRAKVEESDNYGGLLSGYLPFEVEKAAYDMSGVRYVNTTFVYDGQPHAPTAIGLPTGLDGVQVQANISTATEADTHTLTVTFTGSSNYNTPEAKTTQITISQRVVDVVWCDDNFTYNGTNQAGNVTAYYVPVSGDPIELAVSLAGGGEFCEFSQDGYTFTAAFADEFKTINKNYTLANTEAVMHIRKSAVTVQLLPQEAEYAATDLSSALKHDRYEVTAGTVYGEGDSKDDLGITIFVMEGEAVNAGTYTLAGRAFNQNYEVAFINGVFTVDPYGVEVEITPGGGVYGGTIEDASATIEKGGVLGEDAVNCICTYTGTSNSGVSLEEGEKPALAGTYMVTVTLDNPNYTITGTNVATMIISRAFAQVPEIKAEEYDGNEFTPEKIGVQDTELYTVEKANPEEEWKNAGTYGVKLTLRDANNYRWEGTSGAALIVNFTILRAQNSVTDPVLSGDFYYGDAIKPSGAKAEFGEVYYVFADAENAQNYTPTVPTQAGTYYVRAAVAGTENYYGATSTKAIQFIIHPKQIEKPVLEFGSSEFTGAEQSNLLHGYDSSFMTVSVGDLRVSQTPDGLELYATDAGDYVITVVLTDAHNFAWEGGGECSLTWKINALESNTVTITVDPGAVFGGSLDIQISAGAGEAVLVFYADNNGAMGEKLEGEPVNAGTYWVVASVAGTDNYAGGESEPVRFIIAPVTVDAPSLAGTDAVYNGAVQTNRIEGLDVSLMNVTADADIVLSGAQFAVAGRDAGSYGIVFTLKDSVNYVFATGGNSVSLVWKIAPKAISKPTADETAFRENGSVLVYLPVGFDADYMTISGNEQSAAGEYTVTVSLADPKNYVWADGSANPVTFAFSIAEPEADFVWLIAVLSAVLLGEIIGTVVLAKKKPAAEGAPDDPNGPDGGTDDLNPGGPDGGADDLNPDGGEPAGTDGEPAEAGEPAAEEVQEPGGQNPAEGETDAESAPAEDAAENAAAEDAAESAPAEDAAENAAAEEGAAEEQNDHEQNSADGGNADGGAPAGKLYGMAFGFTNLLAAALGGQEWACIGLGAACLILGVVDIVLAVKKFRKAKAEPLPEPEIAEEPVAEIAAEEAVAEPAEETVIVEPIVELVVAEELPEEGDEEDLTAFDEPDEENVSAEEEQRFLALAGLHAGSAWFRYNYSFLAKLALADDAVKEQYASLAEEFSYWNKVKTRTSWKQERVYSGRKNIALVFFRGRKLCVAFALDPAEFAETKYRGTDVSETKRFAATPMMLRITSPRKLKYAIYLFGVAASRLGLERGESGQGKPEVRTATKEELISEGLIRINVVHSEDGETKTIDISRLMQEKMSAEESVAESAEEPVMEEPVAEPVVAEELPEEEDEEDLAAFDEPDEENVSAEEEQRFLALAGLHAGSAWFRYNYSFLAKLALADDAVKEQYASLAEEFSYWNKVKTRTSWKQERVYSGRKNIALMFFRGHKLCVAFALDPAEFAETKYRGIDVSSVKRFAATPMMLRITSPRKLKYAIYLFGVAASRLGLERGESGQGKPEVRSAAKEELIAEGLIRINVVHRGDGTTKTVDFGQFMHGVVTAEPEKAEEAAATETPAEEVIATTEPEAEDAEEVIATTEPEAEDAEEVIATTEPEAEDAEETPVAEMRELLIQQQREFVSAAVAHESLSDETAILLYENDSKTPDSEINGLKRSKRAEVNVDTLSAKFAAHETVTLQKMKERGIVPAGTQAVKILARGILGKPLYVEAQDFSVDAVKMILLTGGKATRVPAEIPSDRRG